MGHTSIRKGHPREPAAAEAAPRPLLPGEILPPGVRFWILAILSHVTAIQRIGHVLARVKD